MALALVNDQQDTEEWATWETFWTLWPKRVARMEAAKAWARLSSVERVAAVSSLPAWRVVWSARGEMQFVPHAATWLNSKRWEDELPEKWLTTSHASHTAAKVPSSAGREPMPQHVRDVLAKLKR